MKKFLLIIVAISAVVVGVYFGFLHNASYSEGVRSGELIKVSHKGILFKTWEGEISQGISGAQIFSFSVLDSEKNAITDLKAGMKLTGIVTNITNFGAFVDIGVHQDGLVHMSQLANKFVSNPNDIVKVSQVVNVTVVDVDIARKRISLTMKTEESPKVKKSESPKDNGSKNKDQVTKSFSKPNFATQPQAKSQPKEADGDLQEKLAKLKGMFN